MRHRRPSPALLLVAILVTLLAAPALAGGGRNLYIAPRGGLVLPAMGDLNEEIELANRTAEIEVLDEIDRGTAVGFELGGVVAPGVTVGLCVERLSASTESKVPGVEFSIDAPATLYGVVARKTMNPFARFSTGVGGAIGMIRSTPEITDTPDTEGRAVFFELFGAGSLRFSPSAVLIAEIGYRHATIDRLEKDNEDLAFLETSDGAAMSLDYSGPVFRVGLQLFFSSRKSAR